jgi:hypothetical protein
MITALLWQSHCAWLASTLGTVSVANIRRITVFFAALYRTCDHRGSCRRSVFLTYVVLDGLAVDVLVAAGAARVAGPLRRHHDAMTCPRDPRRRVRLHLRDGTSSPPDRRPALWLSPLATRTIPMVSCGGDRAVHVMASVMPVDDRERWPIFLQARQDHCGRRCVAGRRSSVAERSRVVPRLAASVNVD